VNIYITTSIVCVGENAIVTTHTSTLDVTCRVYIYTYTYAGV